MDQDSPITQPDTTAPIPYMERTRDYYLALGYGNPYRWAHHSDVPFEPLEKPLSDCRVALITTAAPYRPGAGDQGPGAAYNAAAKFFQVYTGNTEDEPDLGISHLGYDRTHTTADDVNSYFPLARLKAMAASGRIGAVAPHFVGVPTDRSQEATRTRDAPEVLAHLRADQAQAAVLVAA